MIHRTTPMRSFIWLRYVNGTSEPHQENVRVVFYHLSYKNLNANKKKTNSRLSFLGCTNNPNKI